MRSICSYRITRILRRFLDREPISDVTPEEYYQTEEQIQAAVNKLYEILPGHSGSYGVFGQDVDTDNQTYTIPGTRFHVIYGKLV